MCNCLQVFKLTFSFENPIKGVVKQEGSYMKWNVLGDP